MTLRVIDTETTGLDPAVDQIIEIASIDLTNDAFFYNPLECLAKPTVPIKPSASAAHHLIEEDVAKAPPLSEVLPKFNGADFYIAHNAKFDRQFLDGKLKGKDGAEPKWICTMKCAIRAWPEAPGYSNQVLRYWHGMASPFGLVREKIEPHRALSDVFVTAAIFYKLLETAKFNELVAWSSEPALYSKFPFGKHKDEPLSDVPASYLEWVIRSDLDEDMKHSARHWLNARGKVTA